ncbi:MAG: hypothetical protein ACTSXD_08525 [Candidatus Heimdallarchaeaceae archaeon]
MEVEKFRRTFGKGSTVKIPTADGGEEEFYVPMPSARHMVGMYAVMRIMADMDSIRQEAEKEHDEIKKSKILKQATDMFYSQENFKKILDFVYDLESTYYKPVTDEEKEALKDFCSQNISLLASKAIENYVTATTKVNDKLIERVKQIKDAQASK